MALKIKLKIKKAAPDAPPPAPVVPSPEPSRLLDEMFEANRRATSDSLLIPWWLMASWAYYVHDVSMFSDEKYDSMAKEMLAKWDTLTHDHKHVITPEDLKAGSLYRLKAGDYPIRTRAAASQLLQEKDGTKLDVMKDVEQ